MPCQRPPSGHTLAELLVTLAILALVAGMAVPALHRFSAASALQAGVETYVRALNGARILAVSANRGTTVCTLGPDGHCRADWGSDLAVFHDDSRRGQLAREEDLIARMRMAGGEGWQVRWQGFGERRFLHARANGSWRQNGRFTFCAVDRSVPGRELVINANGRVRSALARCD